MIRDGDLFTVPLADGRYGVGVAARTGKRGLVLGYFSSSPFSELPTAEEASFSPDSAIWIALFGDLGIIDGKWSVLGQIVDWSPDQWPIPDFSRHSELSGRSYRITYDGDLTKSPRELTASIEDVAGLPKEGVAGAGFVEIRLSRLLSA